MDTKNNFYKLLDIIKSASTREILEAYKNKIIKFNNLSKLSNDQISEIKMLKIALYVLVTQDLRIKYNNFIESENKLSDKKNINEPSAMNQNDETSLDSLFNVDNTWMTSEKKINDNSLKRNKFENNSIGDRIFSMSQFNKRPGYSTDFEIELRKPLQGREDKSTK
jgi:DnaJ-class molecular chaperone